MRKTFSFDDTLRRECRDLRDLQRKRRCSASRPGLRDSATRPRPLSTPRRSSTTQFNKNIERLPIRCGFSWFSKCNDISGGKTIPGPFHWAGPTDQYFAAVFIPDDPNSAAMVTLRNSMSVARDPQKPDSKEVVNVDVIGAAVGNLQRPDRRSASSWAQGIGSSAEGPRAGSIGRR